MMPRHLARGTPPYSSPYSSPFATDSSIQDAALSAIISVGELVLPLAARAGARHDASAPGKG
ncbi:hypothetical protein ACUN9Y_22295, partial [Halomonas sp. V046]|uniref:hypothetical protein n=1 Tax=Halomonas sp. V046 TaxID=3459611 RepID=UPI004043BB5C